MSFAGDVALGSGSTTLMELAGTGVGEEDQLIAGTIEISGNLNLQSIDGYVGPSLRGQSDDFVFVLADSRVNHFTNITYDGVALSVDFAPTANRSFRDHAGSGMFRNITYTSTTVQLQNLLAPEGDADGEKDVDITDVNFLASNFASDGYWASNAIPEPSSFILSVFGILAVSPFISQREVG